MSWREWIADKEAAEILEVQVPHNVTYWIRHGKVCANGGDCCHDAFKGGQTQPYDFNESLALTQQGVEHFGHGYCRDCYMDLELGSGKKIPGPN